MIRNPPRYGASASHEQLSLPAALAAYRCRFVFLQIVFKIHSREDSSADDTFAANADAPNGDSSGKGSVREIHYYVRLRPGLASFLQKISAVYEVSHSILACW